MVRITEFIYFFPVNVALNKTAYQQHPHITGHHKFDSSNALDGRKFDIRRWGGHCAVSGDKKETATWWVDLTSVHSIHHITIHYMTNNEEWGKVILPTLS